MTSSTDFKVIGSLLALALAIGGAGASFPRLEMLLEICALAVAAYLVVTRRTWRFRRTIYLAIGILSSILLLPLLQLVPLPPSVWTQLPGREAGAEVDAILGWSRWRPLTLDIEGTVRSFFTLLPAAALFAGCMFLSRSERVRLLWIVLAFALVGAVLGIAQVATGGWLTPYPSNHVGYSIGLFVNRNHNAAFLLVAIPVAAMLCALQIARGKPQMPWVVASLSAIIVLAVGVLGTTSRMGLVLLPISLAGSLVLLSYRRSTSRVVLASVVAAAAVASLIFASGRFDRTFARFSGLDDPRFDYWTDIQWALGHYGLTGTGFGTFVPVYKSAESLKAVVAPVTNHAHNDYLEILLEGGIAAVVVFLLFLAVAGIALVRSSRAKSRPDQISTTGAAAVGLAILLAASSVDFPLRLPALSAVFALLCALLLPTNFPWNAAQGSGPPAEMGQPAPAKSPNRPNLGSILIALPILAILLIGVLQAGMSAHHMLNRRYEAALGWAEWSTQAHERISTDALLRNDLALALPHAYSAIALSPISVPAIRTVGLIRTTQGAVAQGNRLMQVAVGLGWRDPLTQLWAIKAAEASREPEKALQRAEALFRQDVLVAPATAQLIAAPPDDRMLLLLAQKVAQRPRWRSNFFKGGGDLPATAADAWVQFAELLARTNAPMSVGEGRPYLDALLANGMTDEAQRLWEVLHRDKLVINGDFEEAGGRASMFPTYWHVPSRSRSRVTVGNPKFDPQTRALHIRDGQDGYILSQTLMLTSGRYMFAYRARAMTPRGATLHWELRCTTSGLRQPSEFQISPAASWQKITSIFTVPIQHCPIQRLALRISGLIGPADVWLDEIRLERILVNYR